MKLHKVANISGLLRVLDNLRDGVTIKTADGVSMDWESQKDLLHSVIKTLGPAGIGSISLHFKNQEDVSDVMSFLLECQRAKKNAA